MAATPQSAAPAPAPAAPRAAARKNPVSVLLTMGVVGGMFAVVALPAYAVVPVATTSTSAASDADAQSVSVSANIAAASTSRDGFTATTPEELAQQLAQQQADALRASYVYTDPGPRAAGDDYPWAGQEGLSPLNYYLGECVDFVAWRLNRDAGYTSAPFKWVWSTLTPTGGSATQWQYAWQAHGWPVSGTPVAGAVAVTDYNHVAYVKEVLGDGTVLIEEYNYGNYHRYGQRIISASSVIAFLYPPG